MDRRFARFLVMLAGAAALCRAAPAAAASGEDEIKATIAFDVLQFVKWPATALPAGRPLVLCATESGDIARRLARFNGAPVNETSLVFKTLDRRLDGLDECHALFVAAGDPYAMLRAAAATHGKPILLIAEGDRALAQGAGIAVSLAGSHVVIDVDLASLNAAGLAVSSKLLRLARTVTK